MTDQLDRIEIMLMRIENNAKTVLPDAVLNLLQSDPHQWSTRPCSTCRTISAIMQRPFGCDLYRQQQVKA